MKLGFIYAGQGSQILHMGEDFFQEIPLFAEVLTQMDPCEGYRKMMFGEDLPLLSQTENTQPCMVSFAIALTAVLRDKGLNPSYTAGLSLGEYSALACSGVLENKEAVDLAAFRGKVMAEGVKGMDSGMTAVLGLDAEYLQEACDSASHLGVVKIANYNCPGQLVLGGETVALEAAVARAKVLGAKRCLPLKVSGPFHTPLMASAGRKLKEYFKTAQFNEEKVPIIFNATGKPKGEGENIPELLVKQVQSSVYFQDSIEYMLQEEVDTFVEIGPGSVLTGFVKKIVKDKGFEGISTYSITDSASLRQILSALT